MINDFDLCELNTTDTEGAKTFYTSLFEWGVETFPMGPEKEYNFIKRETGASGGILNMPDHPPMWLVYISDASVSDLLAKAKDLGATIHVEKTEVPNMGWFAVMADPQGAIFAIWEEMPK